MSASLIETYVSRKPNFCYKPLKLLSVVSKCWRIGRFYQPLKLSAKDGVTSIDKSCESRLPKLADTKKIEQNGIRKIYHAHLIEFRWRKFLRDCGRNDRINYKGTLNCLFETLSWLTYK